MTLSILQGRGHGRDGERGLSVESFPSSRESVFLSPKSNPPLVRGRFLQVESSAVLSLSCSLSPRHTGHRKDRGRCQPLGVPGSPPHAPSPCRAAVKAGAPKQEPGDTGWTWATWRPDSALCPPSPGSLAPICSGCRPPTLWGSLP